MAIRFRSLIRHVLRLGLYGSVGVVLTLLVVFVLYLNNRPDLSVWHLAELDEEFTTTSPVKSFEDYLALEDRLFAQLDERLLARHDLGRYRRRCQPSRQRFLTSTSACVAQKLEQGTCSEQV